MRIFVLVDCNSFFASCEKVFHPEWEKRPVVVLSNNDGCIVARSPEAKALDIPMGIPWFRLKGNPRVKSVIVRSCNYSLYGDMSHRVMQTLSQWSPDQEVYSIDESFLELTGRFPQLRAETQIEMKPEAMEALRTELTELAREIVSTVRQWTGIPVTLGLGTTKTLAKVANRLAKQMGAPFLFLLTKEDRQEKLPKLEIGEVWGIGRHLLPKFQRRGLKNGWQLSEQDPRVIREEFTIVQETLVRELHGEVCLELDDSPPPKQSICYSRSFGEPITSRDEMEKAVSTFVARGAIKLRRQKSVASALSVQIYTNRFRPDQPQYCPGMTAGFPVPTDSTPELIKTALQLLRAMYKEKYSYKKAGILLFNLQDGDQAQRQPFLFNPTPEKEPEQRERERRLMSLMDSINRKFGNETLFFGSEGTDRRWKPSSQFISPCYTTRWEDIPVVYAK